VSLIDVTELMHDPDFVGPICHIGRQARIDSYGQQTLLECSTNTQGSVQPISGRELQKVPEAMRVANMMTFYLAGKIVASEPGKYSDILVFNGCRFQVMTVNDWSAWGAGWTEGVCIAEVPAP
jgi:galactose-6-phosphate isomerase